MSYVAYGIDYTGGLPASTLAHAMIDGHPLEFVIRYLSDYPSKNLTPAEARALSAAGKSIVVVWEDGATDAEQGYAAGVRNAKKALALAKACGMPAGRPILLCVDENTTVGPHVRGYFQGAGSVLGHGARGAYADFAIIKDLFDEGLIDYAMQTYAWSNQRWDPRAQLQQYENDVQLSGAAVDKNRATKADFGQWRVDTPTQEEDVAIITAVGADNAKQTIPGGKNAALTINTVYDDPHKLRSGNVIKPGGYYKAHATARVELSGLTPGGKIRLAWARMSTDGKTHTNDAHWLPVHADEAGELVAALPWQMEVTSSMAIALWIYNDDAKPLAVDSAVVEVDLFKIA